MTEANGDYTDYGYDNVYELTSEVMKDSGGSTIYSISWTYDNVGNRATQTKDGNQTSYTYNSMNQMTAAGSASFTYDSNGNTASKTESQATTNYNWDYENRLAKIDNPSGDDYVYEYDGDGIRVRSGHDSGQGNAWDTRFYYDTDAPLYAYLFESDNNKNMTVAYTIDPGGHLISQRRSGATSYHLYDLLGSTRKFLDSGQTVTDSYSYYAFGEVRTYSGSTPNPFRFVGQFGYYDDPSTDFQYLRARYYTPAWGRFVSVDPVRQLGGNTLLLPAYAYAASHPTVAVDPSGRAAWCSPVIAIFCLTVPIPGTPVSATVSLGIETCTLCCHGQLQKMDIYTFCFLIGFKAWGGCLPGMGVGGAVNCEGLGSVLGFSVCVQGCVGIGWAQVCVQIPSGAVTWAVGFGLCWPVGISGGGCYSWKA